MESQPSRAACTQADEGPLIRSRHAEPPPTREEEMPSFGVEGQAEDWWAFEVQCPQERTGLGAPKPDPPIPLARRQAPAVGADGYGTEQLPR